MRRVVRAALVLVVMLTGSAPAFELRLWPLLEIVDRPGIQRVSLLGPLVEWRRDREGSSFSLRPLLHLSNDPQREATEGAVLYPIATFENGEESFFLRFFGLLSYESTRRAGPSRWNRRFTIFPLVFYRGGPEAETSFAVLPFYGDLKEFAGFHRIRTVLFPLYLKLEEPLYDRTWFLFPFYSRLDGTLGEGQRLWPIWGTTRIGDRYEATYRGWPFFVNVRKHPEHSGEVTTRVRWPFFSVTRGPDVENTIYGFLLVLPVVTHTIDRKAETETWGFPWPLWVSQRDLETGKRLSLRIFPFYQDRRNDVLRSRFFLWPFYRHREGLTGMYERTDVLFFVYRDLTEGTGPRRDRYRTLFPLWSSWLEDGSGGAQTPTLLEGLFPKNPMLRTLYSPLYRLYGQRTGPDGTRHELLWGLLEWGDGGIRPPWYVSPE